MCAKSRQVLTLPCKDAVGFDEVLGPPSNKKVKPIAASLKQKTIEYVKAHRELFPEIAAQFF